MVSREQHKRSFPVITTIMWSLVVIVVAFSSWYAYRHPAQPKEVIVEVPVIKSNTIEIHQKYVLQGAEYTKQVINDVHVTSYNNHTNQTDDTPNVTATSRPVREGMVAVSRDFLTKGIVKYGDLVYIDCFDKWYTIEDTMHERHTKHIDVFLFDKNESIKINKKCGIEIIHITK